MFLISYSYIFTIKRKSVMLVQTIKCVTSISLDLNKRKEILQLLELNIYRL